MTADTIFRLYSMSKPITSVAAMMLVDDGKLGLDDPVSKYIPAFADVKVGVEKRDDSGKKGLVLEPLQRPITIEDLLRHTSGLTYGFYGESAVRRLYANSDLFDGDFDNAAIRRAHRKAAAGRAAGHAVGLRPFDRRARPRHRGGVRAILVSVRKAAAARSARDDRDGVLRLRSAKRSLIAQPLAGRSLRQPACRDQRSDATAALGIRRGRHARHDRRLRALCADAAERRRARRQALSQARDGRADDVGSHRAGNPYRPQLFLLSGRRQRIGLGFAVRTGPLPSMHLSLGEYRWDGVAGTFFFIDPHDDMFVICMMQSASQRGRIQTELKTLVYSALRDLALRRPVRSRAPGRPSPRSSQP